MPKKRKTVITYANELIAEKGEEGAIKVFQDRIDEMVEPKNFNEICKVSGWKVAIEYINGKHQK